jgi:hypothetical protein
MKEKKFNQKQQEVLMQFRLRDFVPHAEIAELIWSELEAWGVLERTLGGYLRLTRYGRDLLAQ